MVSVGTLWTLFSLFGLPLLPKALAFYRSIRYAPKSQLRPPPVKVQRCLNLLFIIIVIHLLRTLPVFQPENIFTATGSRLFYPANSLFNSRVAALRPNNTLTLNDIALKRKLGAEDHMVQKAHRLVYAAYGPDVLLDCLFCSPFSIETYMYYALPAIALPHLIHTFIWGFLTSTRIAGPEGNRWRALAMWICVASGLVELYLSYTYEPSSVLEKNTQLSRPSDTRWFYWEAQVYRNLLFAATDSLLAGLLYFSATNRILVRPPSVAQQMNEASQVLIAGLQQFNLLAPARNAIREDADLRTKSEGYWTAQQKFVEEVQQERDVMNARNVVLSRIDQSAEVRARNYVDGVFDSLQPQQQQQQQQQQHQSQPQT